MATGIVRLEGEFWRTRTDTVELSESQLKELKESFSLSIVRGMKNQ